MSDAEIKQMIIAQLTLALESLPVNGAPGESAPFPAALDRGRFTYDINISREIQPDRASIQQLVEDAVQEAIAQIEPQVMLALGYAMSLFCVLALEVKRSWPDADIQEALRSAALAAADD
ncbi:MAG TPA: hypothetical protein VK162_02060 [Streptosporangiaceae bacterium]|nr:hypothetical protein [Streptosporangiaceae bacterium]